MLYDQYVPVSTHWEIHKKKNNWKRLCLVIIILNIISLLYIASCFNSDSTGDYFTWGESTYKLERL